FEPTKQPTEARAETTKQSLEPTRVDKLPLAAQLQRWLYASNPAGTAIGRKRTLVAVRFRQAFVVQRQTPEAIAQPKPRSTTERRRSGTKPFLQSTT
ncbi:hypothetical protein L7A47_31570, partial [Achromobacter xylosoxidans]|uniref:hypothetical protein n=1 Tax=Alcaligenes xylosoxydans xylosoxydans TaxID=85698 RepID=UPI001F0EB18B